MSKRQKEILNHFQAWSSRTSSELAFLVSAPEASVRRDIQRLRYLGHNISFASPNGVYRLGQ